MPSWVAVSLCPPSLGDSTRTSGTARLNNVRTSDVTSWGLGLVQNISCRGDRALYRLASLRPDVNTERRARRQPPGGMIGARGAGQLARYACQVDDLDIVTAGARVKF